MTEKNAPAITGLIEKKVLIQASSPVVFQALTDAKYLVQWFCDRASSDPRVGGELSAFWKAGKSIRNVVPCPFSLSTEIRAPDFMTIRCTAANPKQPHQNSDAEPKQKDLEGHESSRSAGSIIP